MGEMEKNLLPKEYIYELLTLVSKYNDYLYISIYRDRVMTCISNQMLTYC